MEWEILPGDTEYVSWLEVHATWTLVTDLVDFVDKCVGVAIIIFYTDSIN